MISLGAVVFVGLVIVGYKSSRQIPIPPKASDAARETPTQAANNISPTRAGAATAPAQLSLAITQPIDGTQFTTARIIVAGKTAAKAEVFISDQELIADGSGNFSTSLILDEGENIIMVVANDDSGNSSEQEITVSYNPK